MVEHVFNLGWDYAVNYTGTFYLLYLVVFLAFMGVSVKDIFWPLLRGGDKRFGRAQLLSIPLYLLFVVGEFIYRGDLRLILGMTVAMVLIFWDKFHILLHSDKTEKADKEELK